MAIDEVNRERSETIQTLEARLEQARMFGEQYKNIIASTLGQKERELSPDARMNMVAEKAVAFQEQQNARQSERNLDAHGLLSQAFRTDAQQKILEDRAGYRVEEISKGIYAVFVSSDIHKQLRPGAAATAVMVRDGVSFIYIPEYDDKEFQATSMAENIPHETHHLVWTAAGGNEAFPCREADPDFAKSFVLFQDELLARASSDGGLAGYHHLKGLSPSERKELELQSPGKADVIIQRVVDLNDFLNEFSSLLLRSEKVTKQDLIQGIATAGTFDELEHNLRDMKSIVESLPMKLQQEEQGWGSFTT